MMREEQEYCFDEDVLEEEQGFSRIFLGFLLILSSVEVTVQSPYVSVSGFGRKCAGVSIRGGVSLKMAHKSVKCLICRRCCVIKP